MIGLDTNVLVRYVVQDDQEQSARATELIESLSEESPGFISVVALVESVWVLQRAYRVDRAGVSKLLRGLLDSRELQIEQAEVVRRTIPVWLDSTADFSDALIAQFGLQVGCDYTATFDQRASALTGMRIVSAP